MTSIDLNCGFVIAFSLPVRSKLKQVLVIVAARSTQPNWTFLSLINPNDLHHVDNSDQSCRPQFILTSSIQAQAPQFLHCIGMLLWQRFFLLIDPVDSIGSLISASLKLKPCFVSVHSLQAQIQSSNTLLRRQCPSRLLLFVLLTPCPHTSNPFFKPFGAQQLNVSLVFCMMNHQ